MHFWLNLVGIVNSVMINEAHTEVTFISSSFLLVNAGNLSDKLKNVVKSIWGSLPPIYLYTQA